MQDEDLHNLLKFTQDEMLENILRMESREIDKIIKLQSLCRRSNMEDVDIDGAIALTFKNPASYI
jgi:hypothetical protein